MNGFFAPSSRSPDDVAATSRRLAAITDAFHLPTLTATLNDEARQRGIELNSRMLIMEPELHVTLITMKPHAHIREHRRQGQASLHALTGILRVHRAGGAVDLPANHLLRLKTGILHDVEALEESAFLLTVACPGEAVTEEAQTRLEWGEPW